MLEIEHYYSVDDVDDLDIWERQFNIPPREMAPIVLGQKGHRRLTAGFWSLMPPWAAAHLTARRRLPVHGRPVQLLQIDRLRGTADFQQIKVRRVAPPHSMAR